MLAGDPPIDWDQVKPLREKSVFAGRDESIASVMEKEVLSKNLKALMLFGTFHLMHGQVTQGRETAVSLYEKNYPNVTFVITDLAMFDPGLPKNSKDPFQTWPIPSVARAKGTWLGVLDLDHFIPAGIMIDENCNVQTGFPPNLQGPIERLVDAFLYLGPQDLGLWEQMPADVGLDVDYRMELQRREALSGFPGGQTLKEADQDIVKGAEYPVISAPEPPDPKPMEQGCLERKKQSGTPR